MWETHTLTPLLTPSYNLFRPEKPERKEGSEQWAVKPASAQGFHFIREKGIQLDFKAKHYFLLITVVCSLCLFSETNLPHVLLRLVRLVRLNSA